MPTYLHPGVYLEELRAGAQPIQAIGTSTAAFVGFARRGPIATPEFITRWDEYQSEYGGIYAEDPPDYMGHSVNAFFLNGGSAAYVVRLADGAKAAVALLLDPKLADPSKATAADVVYKFTASSEGDWGNSIRVTLPGGTTPKTLKVELLLPPAPKLAAVPAVTESYRNLSLATGDPGFIGTQLLSSRLIRLQAATAGDYMFGTSVGGEVAADADLTQLNGAGLVVTVNGTPRQVQFVAQQFASGATLPQVAAEIQRQVTTGVTTPAVRDFTATAAGRHLVLRSGAAAPDSAVTVGPPTTGTDGSTMLHLGTAHGGTEQTGKQVLVAQVTVEKQNQQTNVVLELEGGDDGQTATETHFQSVFADFMKLRDISIICLPGMTWDTNGKAVIQDAIAHAEATRSRMVIVDPPHAKEFKTGADVGGLGLTTSTYAALYYPWISVPNPDYNAETNPTVARTVDIPPSGFAAGMWSRIDSRRGVWKAPAGTETGLLGLADLEYIAEDGEQDELNPQGVNCIRRFPGYGQVIWGSRTLATNADPEWRYIPVRRTAMFIEGSIYNGIQWAVFEPNDAQLWSALRASIGSFMDGLFRLGAFQGATAAEAYFVRCGLGSTMTQGDIDSGQVIVLVGFAPVKPAEFVIVRIQQKVGQ
jgi:phage tail sheath protein FI